VKEEFCLNKSEKKNFIHSFKKKKKFYSLKSRTPIDCAMTTIYNITQINRYLFFLKMNEKEEEERRKKKKREDKGEVTTNDIIKII
jgi:hypothetical protein